MKRSTRPAVWLGLALAAALVVVALRSPLPAATAAEGVPATRPDFSGVWLPNAKASGRWPDERPFTPAMLDLRAQWTKATSPFDIGRDDDHTSCLPYTLPFMITTITQYPFEIVSTPKRLHVFTETFGQVRRIDIDAPSAPGDALPSRTGVSRAHWDGPQLVIETTNILPENEGSRFPSSPALRVVERLSLENGGDAGRQLVNEITFHDPPVYATPITIRMVYKWARDVEVGEYICQQDLWDQHLDGSTSRIPWR
jgi:hypothetical protein